MVCPEAKGSKQFSPVPIAKSVMPAGGTHTAEPPLPAVADEEDADDVIGSEGETHAAVTPTSEKARRQTRMRMALNLAEVGRPIGAQKK